MKKLNLLFTQLVFVVIAIIFYKTSSADSICGIIDELQKKDSFVVEKLCKTLGFKRGALGLSDIKGMLLSPNGANFYLQVLSVCWEGPTDGYLVLIDSKGNVLDKMDIGYIKSLSLRPLLKEHTDNLIVETIAGSGTGIRKDNIEVFCVNKGRFVLIWSGLGYEKSFPRGMAPNDNYEIFGNIYFSDLNNDGIEEMIYLKKIIEYYYDSDKKELMPSKTKEEKELYEWKDDIGKYVKG